MAAAPVFTQRPATFETGAFILQREQVMCVVSCLFDHGLTHVRHDILHWLDVPKRVIFKLCMTVYKASVCTEWDRFYLSEMCRCHTGRARRRLVVVICVLLTVVNSSFPLQANDCWQKAFSCAGPSAWNSLPEYLTVDTQSLTLDYFKRSLKCFLFARYWHSAWSTLGICNDSALYKCTLNNYISSIVQSHSHTLCPIKNMWLHFLQ